jgi:hypothetical protein
MTCEELTRDLKENESETDFAKLRKKYFKEESYLCY